MVTITAEIDFQLQIHNKIESESIFVTAKENISDKELEEMLAQEIVNQKGDDLDAYHNAVFTKKEKCPGQKGAWDYWFEVWID